LSRINGNPAPANSAVTRPALRAQTLLAAASALFFSTLTIVARGDDDRPRPPASKTTASATIIDAASGHSFRNHVIPVLTKAGCNSGACHGAAAGKNGFGLTLRGYDPAADYAMLTRQAAGRRVNRLEPARSLLLLKPTETVPHLGGKRFEVDSPEYRVLARWIAAGMPPPSDTDPQLSRIEVTPARETLGIGTSRALRVVAQYSDGHAEDVTRWSRFATADETVAQVDAEGRITMKGPGETAISVGFLTGVASVRVASPFPHRVADEVYAQSARVNFIDDLVLRKLRELNLAPSGQSADHEFLRRAYLDAAGILPTEAEVKSFLADTSSDKRARLIDGLLERPEYVDYWTYKWSDVLLVSTGKLSRNNMRAFSGWIRDSVAANKPWDAFVRELTTASGRSTENGAVNYFLIHRNQIDLAENYTQAFLGLTLTCARCHNHPMEKWTQRDYYAFANLFSRISVKDDGGAKPDSALVISTLDGEIRHPRTGQVLPPTPLDGVPMRPDTAMDRREYLARWLTAPENPLFARTLVNRVWGNFFGRGLVHPVDDLRATNPASNEELLDAVTADFVAHGFDLKHLVRTIMRSAAYQRASEANETNAADDRYYSRYLVRRLPAEVILDALSQVTGVPESFPGYTLGTRALQLPDTRVPSYFLDIFGRPEREITSASERMQDPTLTQALHTINGETLTSKLQADSAFIGQLATSDAAAETIVDRLYLAALSRPPTTEERTRIAAALESAVKDRADSQAARRRAIEDLAWAVFSSKEFLFNH
jgi:hypothetical protein